MKFLVFSDSHGSIEPMRSVLLMHAATTDAVLHLGDGAAEVLTLRAAFPALPFHAVCGNCDSFTYTDFGIMEDKLIVCGEHKLYLCHGHRFGVGGGTSSLAAYAAYRGADIVLFGHTHTAHEAYLPADDSRSDAPPMRIFSPGSIAKPRDEIRPSYGILDIRGNDVLFSVGRWGKIP